MNTGFLFDNSSNPSNLMLFSKTKQTPWKIEISIGYEW